MVSKYGVGGAFYEDTPAVRVTFQSIYYLKWKWVVTTDPLWCCGCGGMNDGVGYWLGV